MLFAAGCGGGGDGQTSVESRDDHAVLAVATPESPDPALVNSATEDLDAVSRQSGESVYVATPAGVTRLLKQGDTLLLAGSSGLCAVTPTGTQVLKDEPIAASVFFADRLWLATEGALATHDGLVKIVPEFATAFTSLAVYGDELYVGTAGNGVWKLEAGKLIPISEDWQVNDLAATNFGLFAATENGLFSYQNDRWHARKLNDTSSALDAPTVLYSRFPYLYVGTGNGLARYDGGKWEEFGLNEPVTALGWHDARLFIGTAAGALLALEGAAAQKVTSPEAGAITSILRFDGRLHVAADGGVFRLRHGRFEKIEWDGPAKSEPKHEPIAFLL
jgi:hypothetical protein